MRQYNDEFYKELVENSRLSAAKIVPIIMQLISPKSVVDVGCGAGVWLSIFQKAGVEDILGIDGPWVSEKYLQIPKDKFMGYDLKDSLPINRKFDLVIALEVAEHIPQKLAEKFVKTLTALGPIILFCAAIPMQGGIRHVNEQWPEYWEKYFQANGYVTVDCIRKKIWQEKISSLYSQNMLIFAQKDYLRKHPILQNEANDAPMPFLSVVHPDFYLYRINPKNMSLRELLAALPFLFKKYLRAKMKSLFSAK